MKQLGKEHKSNKDNSELATESLRDDRILSSPEEALD